jgi:hypothetical protein
MATTTTKATGVPVTMRALMARIGRKLARRNEWLRATRGDRWRGDLGDYFTVGADGIVDTHVNLEELGRELGVLQPFERVVWPE